MTYQFGLPAVQHSIPSLGVLMQKFETFHQLSNSPELELEDSSMWLPNNLRQAMSRTAERRGMKINQLAVELVLSGLVQGRAETRPLMSPDGAKRNSACRQWRFRLPPAALEHARWLALERGTTLSQVLVDCIYTGLVSAEPKQAAA